MVVVAFSLIIMCICSSILSDLALKNKKNQFTNGTSVSTKEGKYDRVATSQ